MITHFSHRVADLSSSFGLRAVFVGAIGIWLSMLGVDTAWAQTTRPYQMSILASTDGYNSAGVYTNAGVDIPIWTVGVFRHDLQPAGRSIVWLPPTRNLDQFVIDWTRIVAVYVDEPYAQLLDADPFCSTPAVRDRAFTLQAMAAALRARAPKARFWVNLSAKEVLAISRGCWINESYIDVISMDVYNVNFQSHVRYLYEDLYNHRPTPYQQLALVAGTFTGPQTGADGASRLAGYFDYAATMNQSCDLPLGPVGLTGFYDGCPVWMVTGFLGGVTPSGAELPIDNPASVLVLNAWQAAFAVQRVDPSMVRRARKALELIPLWFND